MIRLKHILHIKYDLYKVKLLCINHIYVGNVLIMP